MPFDAIGFTPLKVTELPTTPRGRMEYLRDFLKGLPDERFNIEDYFTGGAESLDSLEDCGTAACVAGWAAYVFRQGFSKKDREFPGNRAGRLLGLGEFGSYPRSDADNLFAPDGYCGAPARFTRRAAVRTLRRARDGRGDRHRGGAGAES